MKTIIPYDQVFQLLKQTIGTQVELVDLEIGNQQHDYLVLIIQLHNPSIRVVVKLAGPEAPMASFFDRTAMLHRIVASSTTIPMPEILAINMSYQTWPWRYLIKSFIPGQEWSIVRQQMNNEELSNAYQQIGFAVAQLHNIRFPMFGELALDGSVKGGESYLEVFMERSRASIKSARWRDVFFSVLDKQKHLFVDVHHARLCHEDLHGHNILFQYRQGQWHLATILDFDKAWAGHHEIDLARLEFWRGMMRNEFWKPYEEICPKDSQYKLRRPIYQLFWCLEVAWPTSEHLRDTQRLCAEHGFPIPERFD